MENNENPIKSIFDPKNVRFHAPVEESEFTGMFDPSTNKTGVNNTVARELLDRTNETDESFQDAQNAGDAFLSAWLAYIASGGGEKSSVESRKKSLEANVKELRKSYEKTQSKMLKTLDDKSMLEHKGAMEFWRDVRKLLEKWKINTEESIDTAIKSPIVNKLRYHHLRETDDLAKRLNGLIRKYGMDKSEITNLINSNREEIANLTGKKGFEQLRKLLNISTLLNPVGKFDNFTKDKLTEQNKLYLLNQLEKNKAMFDDNEAIDSVYSSTKDVNERFDKLKPYIQELYDYGMIELN